MKERKICLITGATSGIGRAAREAVVEIRAGQLTELHAKKRPRWLQIALRVEVVLYDLAGGTGTKGVAFGRQVGGSHGFRDSSHAVGNNVYALQPAVDVAARCGDRYCRRGCIHAKYGQYVSNPIDNRNCPFDVAGLRLIDSLCDYAFNICNTQLCWRIRTAAITASRRCTDIDVTGLRPGAAAARTDDQYKQGQR